MTKTFILISSFLTVFLTNLTAQCNRPNASDNPCTAPTFCSTAQLGRFCSSTGTPIAGRSFMRPKGFCGSIENPQWFKFVAESPALSLRFNANNSLGCNGNGVQVAIFETTNCSDSAAYTIKSNCTNAMGGQPVVNVDATGLVAGQIYYLLVDGYQGESCNYTITVNSGTIRLTTDPLPTPSVVAGPTAICANATNVTFSVPKTPNAAEYRFVLTHVTSNVVISDNIRTDSFFVVPAFAGAGNNYKMCVSYKDDCGSESAPQCIDISVSTGATVTLPTVFLCPGSFYELPDGMIVDNTTPPTADDSQTFTANKTGSAGCDTTFNVTVVRYAQRTASRTIFLKPTETVAVCNTVLSINAATCPRSNSVVTCRRSAVNGCDSIISTAVINAKQTLTLTPNNPVLNCNSVTLQVNAADTCAGVRHLKSYSWFYQANAAAPLSNLGVTTASASAANAGIYTVIVKDSVWLSTQPNLGNRVFSDTLKVTVTGSGASTTLPIPNFTNRRTDTTICQGGVTICTINAVPGAIAYDWTIARGGGVLTRLTDTSVSVRWNANASGDTVFVRARSACSISPTRGLAILIINFANLDAGLDRNVCGLTTKLNASSSTGTGTWSLMAGAPGTINFDNPNLTTAEITASRAGVYRLIWKEISNTCEKTDTVQMTFSLPPQLTSIRNICNTARTQFTSTITAGAITTLTFINALTNANLATAAPVNGVATANFTLNSGTYTVRMRDASGCFTDIPVTENCAACDTRAGRMDTTVTLNVCQGDSARAVYLGGFVTDGNDVLQFVLHSGNPVLGIIARSSTPRFGFITGRTNYDQTYYISAIAGDDSTRNVALLDPCLSVSGGTPVVFRRRPTAAIALSDPAVCAGSCTNLRYTLTGRAPFTVTTRISDSTSRDTIVGNLTVNSLVRICPTISTTYRLVAVRDSFGCADSLLTQNVRVTVTQPIKAGTPLPPLSICANLDSTITLSTLLTNPTPGGTWTETSQTNSTGGVFSAARGTFRTRNQAVGTYRFTYKVNPAAGSICIADSATVSIEIVFSPIADAGLDDTINCFPNKRTVFVGGGNTSSGQGISYQWSGPSFGGNTRTTRVSLPGAYVLTVDNGVCRAMDTVRIAIDTVSPTVAIAAVADTITCTRPVLVLDGTRSTPLGQITYQWSYNGLAFDNNPLSQAILGGRYSLLVTRVRNGCTALDSVTVRENTTKPTISIAPIPTITCKDSIVTIDASNSSAGVRYGVRWQSSNGGRFFQDSTTLTPKVKQSGVYQLFVTDNINGCVDSAFRFIPMDTIRPRALAVATDTLDCASQTVALTGRGSTLGATITFNWVARPGNIISGSTTLNPIVDEAGLYVLTVQNDRNFCFDSDTVQVFRNTAQPTGFLVTSRKPTCFGECDARFKVDTTVGGTPPYLYSLDGKVYTTRNQFQNLCAGKVRLFVQDAGGCQLDTNFTIVQDPELSVSMGGDTTIRLGDSILLTVQTNAVGVKSIKWTGIDSSSCKGGNCNQVWVRPVVGTIFTATVTDSNNCSAVGKINISIDKKSDRIYMPTAFSPNSDGTNDVFYVQGTSAIKRIKRFMVYDRWGEQMFAVNEIQPNDPTKGWSGRMKNRDASPGVYVYYVEVEYQDNTTAIIEGDVTLMR
jgi:gliding motility-associated-like protein